MSNASRIEVFLEIMRNLTCLEEYTIVSNHPIMGSYEAPRIHEAWPTFASNLRTLRLIMPASGFRAFVPPPKIQCTNLRVLHLNLTLQNLLNVNIPSYFAPVCEFTNSLHGTLEELSIEGNVFPLFDWLFQRLCNFERLHSLTIRAISIGTPFTAAHGTLDFLNKHQDRIHHLNLSFPTLIAPFELPELRILNLASLEIAQVTLVTNQDHTSHFFHAISHSLVKLSIQNILPRPDLFNFLSSFPAENCLKTLVLSQRSFDADLILLLAFYLPRLRSLTLHVGAEDLTLPPTSIHAPGSTVADNAYRASLAQWKLNDITITRCRSHGARCSLLRKRTHAHSGPKAEVASGRETMAVLWRVLYLSP
ncbi:hypothetical protein BD779DRAFT_1470837 [Infundibulicybe gibba]|nr:hypothetical protein BD779DRAFT_1470837 [Infundibulicybe gibba]